MISEWKYFYKMWLRVIFVAVLLNRSIRGLSMIGVAAENSPKNLSTSNLNTLHVLSQKLMQNNNFEFVHVNFDADYEDEDVAVNNRGSFDVTTTTTSNPNAKKEIVINFPYTEIQDPRQNTIARTNKSEPIIIKFNINEIQNGTPSSRSGIYDFTDDYDDNYTTDETLPEINNTISKIPLTDDTTTIPIECKYGTLENPIPDFKIDKTGRRVSDIKCQEYKWDLKYRIVDAEYYKSQCDREQLISGVIGGKKAEQGEFPHLVALGWLRNGRNSKPLYLCGSSLISPRFVITAAHCRSISPRLASIYNISSVEPKVAIVGSVNLNEGYGRMEVNIDSIMVHPEYEKSPQEHYNDIALVRFVEEVQISLHARPACLWSGALGRHTSGNITGWGQTIRGDSDSRQTHLRYAKLDFIDSNLCRNWAKTKVNRNWRRGLIDSQFCAGVLTGGVDSCQGDSGGPIQVQEAIPNSDVPMYHVVGITSFGSSCARANEPGIYTNVTSFQCWIEKTVWPEEANSACNEDSHDL